MRAGVRILVAACALFAFLASEGTAAAQQPNIVVILTDDQRWDTLAFMPNVQSELVARGVTFENGFVTNPVCCPSRASILTGSYSHSSMVYRNAGLLGGFPAFRDRSTIATWLHDAGYRTALIGKYLNGYPGGYVPPGWDRWVAFTRIGYRTYGLDVDGVELPVEERPYSTDFLAQEAVAFIRSSPSPFFLYLAPYAPHAGAHPADRHADAFSDLPPLRPPSYNERDVSDKPRWMQALPRLTAEQRRSLDTLRRNQLRSLLAVDDGVAAVIQALSETGQLENTMIVYMSDNGLLLGEHRWRARKKVAYDEAIRVPFVVRHDALVDTPRLDPRPVLGIDLAPTFAALAGVSAPNSEGRSLVPLISGADTRWRTRFLVEGLDRAPPTYCALRTSRYAFVTYRTGEHELYDVTVDPYELRNLARTPGGARIVKSLRPPLARLCNPPPPGLDRRLLCTHVGTKANDTLDGTPRYDILCAAGGDDLIRGYEGSDYVYPGTGHDVVLAGEGDDHVLTRDGFRDRIACGPGRDRVLADLVDRVGSSCERVRRP